jgi:cyclin G2
MRLDEVNSSQRNHASSWLRKVAASLHFGIDTYALSVELLDRFMATLKVRPKFLECLAVGCLYIAAKCKEEDDAIPITPEFVIDCNASCSANELLRMERLILDKFDWFADHVTSVDFLQTYFALLLHTVGGGQQSPHESERTTTAKK